MVNWRGVGSECHSVYVHSAICETGVVVLLDLWSLEMGYMMPYIVYVHFAISIIWCSGIP